MHFPDPQIQKSYASTYENLQKSLILEDFQHRTDFSVSPHPDSPAGSHKNKPRSFFELHGDLYEIGPKEYLLTR